ncbi:hypothetical protein GWK51_08235 [Acinetobacter sp. PS-1]|nr:hypothetical protein [Acinetobacter kanungonis]
MAVYPTQQNHFESDTPFSAPAFDSSGGTMKRYLAEDIEAWEQKCQNSAQYKKEVERSVKPI